MLFTLEALQADHGDSLILHYGDADAPRFILIDGGPTLGGYRRVIRPRLLAIRDAFAQDRLELEMVMLSHIDDDHIHGLLGLTGELVELEENGEPAPFNINTLWFNSFDDILNNEDQEIGSRLVEGAQAAGAGSSVRLGDREADDYQRAVIASVPQGRKLRAAADRLEIHRNARFAGLILAGEDAAHALDWDDHLKLTVIAPNEARVRALQQLWDEDVAANPSDANVARAAAFDDNSVANLSSIVVLAEVGGKSMLLTGDARGDHILEGLEAAGLLNQGRLHVDLFKLPHHGSSRNVTEEFFRQITADHYVISANGRHHNPDMETLGWIHAARDDDDFTLHFTNREGKHHLGEELTRFEADVRGDRRYGMRYRDADAPSLQVDLLDAVEY